MGFLDEARATIARLRAFTPDTELSAALPPPPGASIGRFEHVRVRRDNQGQHRIPFSLDRGSTFGNRPVAVKVSAVSDPCPATVKVGLGSTWAEPRLHANGRNRRDRAPLG
jgi:hypothetical protein